MINFIDIETERGLRIAFKVSVLHDQQCAKRRDRPFLLPQITEKRVAKLSQFDNTPRLIQLDLFTQLFSTQF